MFWKKAKWQIYIFVKNTFCYSRFCWLPVFLVSHCKKLQYVIHGKMTYRQRKRQGQFLWPKNHNCGLNKVTNVAGVIKRVMTFQLFGWHLVTIYWWYIWQAWCISLGICREQCTLFYWRVALLPGSCLVYLSELAKCASVLKIYYRGLSSYSTALKRNICVVNFGHIINHRSNYTYLHGSKEGRVL